MIQTYEPYRGIIICRSGGSYVSTADHLTEIAKKDKEIKRLKEEMKRMVKFIPRDITETSWTTTR